MREDYSGNGKSNIPFLFKLVWRLPEFAFFMRLLLLNEYKEVLRNGDTMGI